MIPGMSGPGRSGSYARYAGMAVIVHLNAENSAENFAGGAKLEYATR